MFTVWKQLNGLVFSSAYHTSKERGRTRKRAGKGVGLRRRRI